MPTLSRDDAALILAYFDAVDNAAHWPALEAYMQGLGYDDPEAEIARVTEVLRS